jgi:hypothetical protein
MGNDRLGEWQALLALSAATLFAVIDVVSLISILLGYRVLLPHSKGEFLSLWTSIGLSLYILNFKTLVSNRKWCRYEQEFQKYSNVYKVCVGVIFVICVVMLFETSLHAGWNAFQLPDSSH